MPVSVQLVGRRNEDEKVIAVAKLLEEHSVIGIDKHNAPVR
jgi:Asp-tRNA(Asn)/Glu-tRNA(Gln) amidotransferase A subunit family amidase